MEIKIHKQQKYSFNKKVMMLGTFHPCMSFYGSVGYIMVSSGIQSLLEIIYAEHTVPHILSGKTFSSETRYHLTTADMLYALLIGNIHNINFELNVDEENFASEFHEALNRKTELSIFARRIDEILTKKIISDNLTMLHEHIIRIREKLEHYKKNQHENKNA